MHSKQKRRNNEKTRKIGNIERNRKQRKTERISKKERKTRE